MVIKNKSIKKNLKDKKPHQKRHLKKINFPSTNLNIIPHPSKTTIPSNSTLYKIKNPTKKEKQAIPPITFLKNYYRMVFYFVNKVKYIKMSTTSLCLMPISINWKRELILFSNKIFIILIGREIGIWVWVNMQMARVWKAGKAGN